VSIDPILAVPGIRQALISTQPGQRLVLAVSPIIAGQAVKGPAAKMYLELGKVPSSLAVARHYGAQVDGGLLDGFVIDTLDSIQAQSVIDLSIRLLVTETLMKNPLDRSTLAEKILNFAEQF
jgi:LPPG:FO 2-phospho-L-lactate transferase